MKETSTNQDTVQCTSKDTAHIRSVFKVQLSLIFRRELEYKSSLEKLRVRPRMACTFFKPTPKSWETLPPTDYYVNKCGTTNVN